ncbi:DUF87 domain-containing protein [uncultured Agrobacterium sp.]|uniref:ATP-binding protein n=1 Tax=uncultured Agrobacterium sp. TaxID=157277 RepID=UPI0025DFFC38|nr:DUF87 domain-containing protein [uncultured Agrobacterium sp.]
MFNDDLRASAKAGEHDRRDEQTAASRMLGRVVSCSGSKARISVTITNDDPNVAKLWSVGRLISIDLGSTRVTALTYAMNIDGSSWSDHDANTLLVDVELLGEIYSTEDGIELFSSGITRYPHLGAVAHRIRASDLMRIYENSAAGSCIIGNLSQDQSVDAMINIPQLLSKHFAVLGSTGVGKTTAVTLLLNKAIEKDPKLRVLILDPHNEFAAAFPTTSVVIDTDTLDLPFWLMKLEEFAEVVFRGQKPPAEELDILRDLIPDAKRAFRGTDMSHIRRASEKSSLTADTPVPYRIADLLALIDERLGRLEGRDEKPALRTLKLRIMAAINDPRYHFMFSNSTINDTIIETVAHIFRVPGDGKPISVFQLAGIPSEVVNSVASVLCRMAFELALWSQGSIHTLVVCEEAHRYVPSDPELGFFPTRQAIARIAKEGRKYGVSLGIITQRPGELDQTILSQCSTVFAMRLSNDKDQEIIRSAISGSSSSTISFLSSLGNGEAIAFGEGVSVPMRMQFKRLPQHMLPKAGSVTAAIHDDTPDNVDLRSIVKRMRSVSGPDISGFRQSYDATVAKEMSETDMDDWAYDRPGEVGNGFEPYRPHMLPRGNPTATPKPPQQQPASISSTERNAPVDHDTMRPFFTSETRSSIRETLLKKPLGSLYRKD